MEENVNLELEARTKEEVFTQMTRMLYENGAIREEQPFIDELVHREAEGVTGIGEGDVYKRQAQRNSGKSRKSTPASIASTIRLCLSISKKSVMTTRSRSITLRI